MAVPSLVALAIEHYTRAMRPCTSDDGFDHRRAESAIVDFVHDLTDAGERPAAIVNLAVELVPLRGSQAQSVWGLSLRDWVRTTARNALARTALGRTARAQADAPHDARAHGLRLER